VADSLADLELRLIGFDDGRPERHPHGAQSPSGKLPRAEPDHADVVAGSLFIAVDSIPQSYADAHRTPDGASAWAIERVVRPGRRSSSGERETERAQSGLSLHRRAVGSLRVAQKLGEAVVDR
jgi:hypothetical protein